MSIYSINATFNFMENNLMDFENEDIYVQTLLSAYLFYSIIYTIKMHVQIPIGLHPMKVGEKVS